MGILPYARIRAGVPLPGTIQSAAPRLGEHTDEILRGIGYDEAKIAGLRTAGITRPTVLDEAGA